MRLLATRLRTLRSRSSRRYALLTVGRVFQDGKLVLDDRFGSRCRSINPPDSFETVIGRVTRDETVQKRNGRPPPRRRGRYGYGPLKTYLFDIECGSARSPRPDGSTTNGSYGSRTRPLVLVYVAATNMFASRQIGLSMHSSALVGERSRKFIRTSRNVPDQARLLLDDSRTRGYLRTRRVNPASRNTDRWRS